MITNLVEYQKHALVTKAFAPEGMTDLDHCALGLVTEVAEIVDQYKKHWFYNKPLDMVNIKEEIGDILWYLAVGLNYLKAEMPQELFPVSNSMELTVKRALIRLNNKVASFFAFTGLYHDPKQEEEGFAYDLFGLLNIVNHFCFIIGVDIIECADANIQKLMKRYPEGFTEFHAVNRDTENELSHITQETIKEDPVST